MSPMHDSILKTFIDGDKANSLAYIPQVKVMQTFSIIGDFSQDEFQHMFLDPTPMQYAIIRNKTKCLQKLLELFENSSVEDVLKVLSPKCSNTKYSCLNLAIMMHHNECVQTIIEFCKSYSKFDLLTSVLNEKSCSFGKETPLHFAVKYKNPDAFRFLLNFNADLNAKDINGYPVLFNIYLDDRDNFPQYVDESVINNPKYKETVTSFFCRKGVLSKDPNNPKSELEMDEILDSMRIEKETFLRLKTRFFPHDQPEEIPPPEIQVNKPIELQEPDEICACEKCGDVNDNDLKICSICNKFFCWKHIKLHESSCSMLKKPN